MLRSYRCLMAFFTFAAAARVVELVDTQDLKSCGHCGCTGSIPVPGTKRLSHFQNEAVFFFIKAINKEFSRPLPNEKLLFDSA